MIELPYYPDSHDLLTFFQQSAAAIYTCTKDVQLPSQVLSLATRSVTIISSDIPQETYLFE